MRSDDEGGGEMADAKHDKLVQRVVSNATQEQKEALIPWLEQLLEIKGSDRTSIDKASPLKATAERQVILPILKLVAQEVGLANLERQKFKFSDPASMMKAIQDLWSRQSLPSKLGIGSSALALAIFGSQSAGIAALGTAVGVPLWIVLGAGGAWAGVVLEQLKGRS